MVDYDICKEHLFYVFDDKTMSIDCLLSRDFINGMNIYFGKSGRITLKTQKSHVNDSFFKKLLLIEY